MKAGKRKVLKIGVSSKVCEEEWCHFRTLCQACERRPVMNGHRYCHPCDDEIREMHDDGDLRPLR